MNSTVFWSECRDSNSRPLEPHYRVTHRIIVKYKKYTEIGMNERYKYSLFSIFYIKNFFKFHIQKTVQDTFKLIKTCYQMRLYKAQYIESWIYGVPAYAFFVSKYCIQRLSYTDSNSIVNLSLLNLHRSISIKYLLHKRID